MSDNVASHQPPASDPSTIAEALQGLKPMGDLSRFAIEDLTPAEADLFFQILESL